MRKCGLENFTIEGIERCETLEQAKHQECFWIRVLNCTVPNGYNQSNGGEGGYRKLPNAKRIIVENSQQGVAAQVKRIAAYRGYSVKALGEAFNQKFGTNYAQQSFSRKINNQSISWEELNQLGELLNFQVKLELDEQATDDEKFLSPEDKRLVETFGRLPEKTRAKFAGLLDDYAKLTDLVDGNGG